MSEIDRKSGLFLRESEVEDTLTCTTPGSVAAIISSALETADAVPEDEQEETSTHFLKSHYLTTTEDTITKSSIEDKIYYSNNNNNNLVRTTTSEYRLFDCSRRSFEGGLFGATRNVHGSEDCDHHRILNSGRNNADGNYVREIYEVSSACSPFISSKSTSMADNKESSDRVNRSSDKTIRDKSDNRETYPVSHCKEKSATEETISSNNSLCAVKPSSNKIHLPEKSSSSIRVTSASDHHHHHRSKDSKIPVGIAVAWQRLVTSNSTISTTSSAMNTRAESGPNSSTQKHHHHHHHNTNKNLNSASLSLTGMKSPARASSASPLSQKTTKMSSSGKQASTLSGNNGCNFNYANENSDKAAGNFVLGREKSDKANANDTNRPLSACGETIGGLVPFCPSSPAAPSASASPLSRPLPSSSVPPNLGYPSGTTFHHPQYPPNPYHRGSPYMEYSYGVSGNNVNSSRSFAVPTSLASPHHSSYLGNGHQYWGGLGVPGLENSVVPHLSPGMPNSPGAADYLQLSMQQQMHLHQQHLLAGSRQSSLSLSSSPSPLSSPVSYNPYLQFLYPNPQDASSMSSKSAYYDHYFHQQHRQQQHELLCQQQQQQMIQSSIFAQQQQQQQQQQQSSGINSNSVNNSNNNNINENGINVSTSNNTTSSASSVSSYDLLANNTYSGGSSQHRTIPMLVASSSSNIPHPSCSPTGGIRNPTPTSTSSASAASAEASDTGAATTRTTAQTVDITSTSINTGSRTSVTASQQQPSHQNSQSGTASGSGSTTTGELSSSYSSASSPSPSFLLIHQHQHPHLFTSSSAALSPKSLTSSTPSPVTVHDFNSGLNVVIGSSSSNSNLTTSSSSSVMLTARKCATPSPISLTPRPLLSPFSSPFSPSPTLSGQNNNGSFKELVWKEDDPASKVAPILVNGQGIGEKEGSVGTSGGSSQTSTPTSSPLLLRRTKQVSIPTPLSSPSNHKHDFKRLESLIERRDSESISPLVLIPQHSPATSTTSSILDSDESRVLLLQGDIESERKIIPAFHVPKIDDTEESRESVGPSEMERFDRMKKESCKSTDVSSSNSTSITPSGNDSFKVKPQRSLYLQPNHLDSYEHNDIKGTVKAEKVLEESYVLKEESALKTSNSNTINRCDVDNSTSTTVQIKVSNKNQHGGDQICNAVLAKNEIDKIDVPESTLPFSSNTDNKDKDSYNVSATLTSFKTKVVENQTVKDVSFTSGYSSSHDDDHEFTKTDDIDACPVEKCKNIPKQKDNKISSPSLKFLTKKDKEGSQIKGTGSPPKRDMKNLSTDKLPKSKENKCKKLVKPVENILPLRCLSTKTIGKSKNPKLMKEEMAKTKKQNAESLDATKEIAVSVKRKMKFQNQVEGESKKKKRKESLTDKSVRGVDAMNIKEKKKKISKTKTTTVSDPLENSKKSKTSKEIKTVKKNGKIEKGKQTGNKSTKKTPVTKRDSTIYQLGSSESSNTNSKTAKHATSERHGTSASGDKMTSVNSYKTFNYNNNGDHNCSLTISTTPMTSSQQQPVALILQSPTFGSPSSASPPMSCPSQVTFLIASPTAPSSSTPCTSQVNHGSTLKIPAYIPRSATAIESESAIVPPPNYSSLTAEELVGGGESYSGPATLTLHRDVDAIQHQSYYQQQQQHPPPTITIQYHHSAPATPLMEASSPYGSMKPEENSLDLLATVAQEFGSREDLGKRLSIDGSCNNSIFGESPPMSPMKSPNYPAILEHQNQNLGHKSVENVGIDQSTPKYVKCPKTGITGSPLPKMKQAKNLKDGERKNEALSPTSKKTKKAKEKTTNSIMVKKVKAGKKQKRSVSDSAAAHPPPVVLLKIPHVQRPKLPSILEANKRKEKSKKNKINNKSADIDKNAPKTVNEQQQKESKKQVKAVKEGDYKAEKKKMKKSMKALSLPADSISEKKPKGEKDNKKKEKKAKKNKLENSFNSHPLLSPLKLTTDLETPGISVTSPKISKSPGATFSSCFYNPPERISAFAKQVMARRDSAASPIKGTVSQQNIQGESRKNSDSDNDPTTSSSLPKSPTIKMPQLIPFDIEPSSQHSDTVPKVMRFPCSAPPPLLPSVSTELCDKTEYKHFEFEASEQDQKTDFSSYNRSPISSRNSSDSISLKSSIMSDRVSEPPKIKKKKRKDVCKAELFKTGKVKKRKQQSEDTTVVIKAPKPKQKTERSQSLSKSSVSDVFSSLLPTIPTITITSTGVPTSNQHSVPTNSPTTLNSLSPSPVVKPSQEEEEEFITKRPYSRLHVLGSTPSSSRPSSPSNLGNEDEGEAETTENENENDFNNAWVSDPMFAVSAIKLSNSSHPSDASSVGGDDNSLVDVEDVESIRTDSDLIKSASAVDSCYNKSTTLSLYNKQTSPTEVKNISVEQQQERDRFLEVKTQLKAFVHFKPKQLNRKKKSHNIKPCLKAEPVVRSQSGPDDDDDDDDDDDEDVDDNVDVEAEDEDFALDMEVANITTQHAPKGITRRKGSKDGNSSSAATSTGSTRKKPSINRNSFSYLSNSSSKKNHPPATPLSTKEIMSKVFSRKVSPDLGEKKRHLHQQQHYRQSPTKKRYFSGTEMDADDEDDEEEEDELLDIDEPVPHSSKLPKMSMTAAATAIVVNNVSNLSAASSANSVIAPVPIKKTPKKRSARSSTTSSSASTKSNSRGNRGQSLTGYSASATPSTSSSSAPQVTSKDEVACPGKVELDSVEELVDEMRILTEIQGLFYTGRLNALQPPDVYGVTLDNERGAPPHLIFSAEEVLEKCLREKKPQTMSSGLRICAYWSPQYSGLYPGRVSSDFNPKFDPEEDLIPIEFDDGDTGMIKLKEIRLLSVNHPVREYDPNPLLTLEKKHRKRRHSSATGTSGGCTGDHEEPDCGEPYCAKIEKLKEEEEEEEDEDDNIEARHSSSKMLYWTWSGLGYKRPKCKKNRNKEFFHGIQRGNEVINVGDSALFISTGNERPFIGRVERFWERKGKKMVNVRWFYHPEEVKASAKRLSNLKYPGALFESPHIDENDVQTIAKKCEVLPFAEFKQRLSTNSNGSLRLAKLSTKSTSKPRNMYYVAGFYDPYTYNLKLKDLK